MKKIEFTYKTELIFDLDFNSKLVEFNGIKIGQNLSKLPIKNISDFYDEDDKNKKLDIKNGWVLTKNGIQYVLKKGIIKIIRVKQNGIKTLNKFDREKVEKLIGKPNRVSNDSGLTILDRTLCCEI